MGVSMGVSGGEDSGIVGGMSVIPNSARTSS